MKKIPEEKIYERWDLMSDELKEAIYNPLNIDIIDNVCNLNHLDDKKTLAIKVIVSEILFGFIYAQDFAQEIKNELGVDIRIADNIAFEVNRKIFDQFKNELEKLYQPLSKERPETSQAEKISLEGTVDLKQSQINDKNPEAKKTGQDFSNIVAQKVEGQEINLKEVNFSEPLSPGVDSANQEASAQDVSVKADILKDQKVELNGNLYAQPYMPKLEVASEKNSIPEQATFLNNDFGNVDTAQIKLDAPVIIHSNEDLPTIEEKKKSLGGVFGLFRKSSSAKLQKSYLDSTADNITAKIDSFGQLNQKSTESKSEMPKIKIIHYSDTAITKEELNPQAVKPEEKPQIIQEPIIKEPAKPQETFDLTNQNNESQKTEMQILSDVKIENNFNKIMPESELVNDAIDLKAQPAVSIENTKVLKSPEQIQPEIAKAPENPMEKNFPVNNLISSDSVKLEDIPVSNEVIDLRLLEKINDEKKV